MAFVGAGIPPSDSASAWLMWVGFLINYFVLIVLTVKVWKRRA